MPNKSKKKSRKNKAQKPEEDGAQGQNESQPAGQQESEDGVALKGTGAEDDVPFEGIEDAVPEDDEDPMSDEEEDDQEDAAPINDNMTVVYEVYEDTAPEEPQPAEVREATRQFNYTFMHFKFAQTHFRESRERRKHAKEHHKNAKEAVWSAQRKLWFARERLGIEEGQFDEASKARIAAIHQFRAAHKRIKEAKRKLRRARRRVEALGVGAQEEQRPVCGSFHKCLKAERCPKDSCLSSGLGAS